MLRVNMLKKYTRVTRAQPTAWEQSQGTARAPHSEQMPTPELRAGPASGPLPIKEFQSNIQNCILH